jgi:AAA domain
MTAATQKAPSHSAQVERVAAVLTNSGGGEKGGMAALAYAERELGLPPEHAEAIVVEARASQGRRVAITWASEIPMANVVWIWENRIPLGMLSGLYGVEGMGKSMETIRIAAAVTRGDLPGALEGNPRRVLIATTEDTWRHTIKPRLVAAGADVSMVGHFRVADGDRDGGFELPRDAEILAEAAAEHEVGLVILDPVLSHLEGRADSHNTKDVRKALEPLQRAAETAEFGVLGIMHFNKEKGSDTRQRSQASSAFREVFRSTLVFGPDPDRPEDASARVVALDKNNLVPPQPSYRMRIEGVTLDDTDPKTGEPIKTARIVLGEPCAYTAEELLDAASGRRDAGISDAAETARLFLVRQLDDGKGAANISGTKAAAEAEGISVTALDKARKNLGLKSRRIAGAEATEWEWYDPVAAGEKLGIAE